MSLDIHKRAEALMAAADAMAAQGLGADARDLYEQAAHLEADAYERIPLDRPRTKGIIARSVVALHRKAGNPAEAVRRAHLFLAEPDLDDPAREDLENVLHHLRAEAIEQQNGRAFSPDWFEWRLRGGSVGTGTAPMALVAAKIDQIQKYATRVYEFLAGVPLRIQGPVDESVREGMELVMSQPAAGSFRFSVRLSMPTTQTTLFDNGEPVAPAQVGETFFRVLEATMGSDQADLFKTVPDPGYQDAFLHLVRNLVPDGKNISEIEVTRSGSDSPAVAVLRATNRAQLDRQIRARRPPRSEGQKERVRVDTLRGLQLNQHWIVLGTEGHERKCWVGDSIVLEDVVEGLVNHRVRVTGHFEHGKFMIEDIVAAEPDEVESPPDAPSRLRSDGETR